MVKELRTARQIPTASVILPYTKSKGKVAIQLYELTGRTAQDWQKLLLEDILAVNDEGLWVHPRFAYSVPRRNGKTEDVYMRELYGLMTGEHIMHTAHLTTTAHASWEKLEKFVAKMGVKYTSNRALGRERITILDTGGVIEYRTRTSKSGLGEGYDLLVIDEAQEYTNDQETALKYIVSDSKNPQIIMLGTPPTPVSHGTVFTQFRKDVFAGELPDSGWAEWSVEEMTDPHDIDAWYETNPSLGVILSERKILDEIGPDKIDFNIQRLGLFIKYNLKSAITENEWNELECKTPPKLVSKPFIGIKYGKDGNNVALSVACKTNDGKTFVEAIDCRPIRDGTDWVIKFLLECKYEKVAIDGSIGQQLLTPLLKEQGIKRYYFPTVKEIIAANAGFEQSVVDQTLCHMAQPSLKQSVTNCEHRAIGSNGGFGFRSIRDGVEIALLDSVALAEWLCMTSKERRQQQISY